MFAFILRRLLAMVPLLLGISLVVFYLMNLAPGDFLDEVRARPDFPKETVKRLEIQYGLRDDAGKPTTVWHRYLYWANTVSPVKILDDNGKPEWIPHFGAPSLGYSWAYDIPVTQLIGQRLPATLLLAVSSLLLSWLVAIPLGVAAAVKKDSWFDHLSAFFAYAALSIPDFFLALLALYFAAKTGLFPSGGATAFSADFMPAWYRFGDRMWHLVLPTVVLSLGGIASLMRVMRTNMLDYLRMEFVTTARAKGVPEGRVLYLHVLRNAINPLITSLGFALAGILSGDVLVENVLNYPGLGLLIYQTLIRRDQFVAMTAIMLGCIMLMLGNLVADILLAASDPRIRLEGSSSAAPASRRRGVNWALGVAALILAVLVGGIVALPWQDAKAMERVITVGEISSGILLTLAMLAVAWAARDTLLRMARGLWHRPWGLASALVLLLLYIGALFAPFFAVAPVDAQNLDQTYHPPTALVWQNGRLNARLYVDVDRSSAHYEPQEGAVLPLKFFAPGFAYKLFGFIPANRHFILPDYSALPNTDGKPPKPDDYPLYLLGSDTTGRDVFSRLLFGSQVSLTIGLVGIAITTVMGFVIGGLAGYFGGSFDFFSMRFVEFLMAIPGFYLLLALRSALAPYFQSGEMFLVIIVILSLVGWAGTARVLRGMSLSLRERPFVTAAECLGQSTWKILFRHFLPNLAGYLLVTATLSIPGYILGEASLSFLGLGIQEPSASWGLMLRQSQQDMKVLMLDLWWLLLPGAAIFVTVVAFNFLGDALRDIVDPKMKTR